MCFSEYVYIMMSHPKGLFYVGRTKELTRRVWQHRNAILRGHTAQYRINQLAYWEIQASWEAAHRRERTIKRWPRAWKINLIEGMNPGWRDLWFDIIEQDPNPQIPTGVKGPYDPSIVVRPEE
jgi:putative endonuclease